MCARVARHPAEWSLVVPLAIDRGMPKELPQNLARRARLSSKAIVTAIILTIAALAAVAIAARQQSASSVKTLGPVTQIPVESDSVLVPVVDR
jgi:hypothetical protein